MPLYTFDVIGHPVRSGSINVARFSLLLHSAASRAAIDIVNGTSHRARCLPPAALPKAFPLPFTDFPHLNATGPKPTNPPTHQPTNPPTHQPINQRRPGHVSSAFGLSWSKGE
jgi:hypothetical protein